MNNWTPVKVTIQINVKISIIKIQFVMKGIMYRDQEEFTAGIQGGSTKENQAIEYTT